MNARREPIALQLRLEQDPAVVRCTGAGIEQRALLGGTEPDSARPRIEDGAAGDGQLFGRVTQDEAVSHKGENRCGKPYAGAIAIR